MRMIAYCIVIADDPLLAVRRRENMLLLLLSAEVLVGRWMIRGGKSKSGSKIHDSDL